LLPARGLDGSHTLRSGIRAVLLWRGDQDRALGTAHDLRSDASEKDAIDQAEFVTAECNQVALRPTGVLEEGFGDLAVQTCPVDAPMRSPLHLAKGGIKPRASAGAIQVD
jgi:hypothetical protein